jgi:hypothetical protein
MENANEILILRLKSGEDIISCLIDLPDDKVKLDNPLCMVYKTVDTGSMLLLTPWLPFEFITENVTSIDKSEILATMNPSIRMVNIYTKSLISLYDTTHKDDAKESLSFFSKISSGSIH